MLAAKNQIKTKIIKQDINDNNKFKSNLNNINIVKNSLAFTRPDFHDDLFQSL